MISALDAAGAAPDAAFAGGVRRSGRALGSPLHLTIAADALEDQERAALADLAWQAVVEVFAAVDRAMSRFREDSELTGLNRHRAEPAERVSRVLMRALCAANRAVRITEGRFDPRVTDALESIGYAGAPLGAGGVPLASARTAGSAGLPILDRLGRTGPIRLPVPVDLGGIGKGLALRWARRRVRDVLGDGDSGHLIEAGGDIAGAGSAPGGGSWRVGIEDPTGDPVPLAVIEIAGDGAVATSSVRRLHWLLDGREVHHLIDPRTGAPAVTGLRAVTVAGPDPAWAEVWSKALFVEGRRGIAALARGRALAAWWVTDDGDLEMTPSARMRTTWVASEDGRA